jgi:uncharacterized membrane protein (DUF485 family)
VELDKMRMMLTILLALIIMFLAALLITAYIVTPIIGWLLMNPLGGIALLIVTFALTGILVWEEVKEE